MHLRTKKDLDSFFAFYEVDPAWRAEIRSAVQPVVLVDETGSDIKWVSRIRGEDWFYWDRLHDYMIAGKGWDESDVESISLWSLRILERMPDPLSPGFRSQGLVIGYVQAGKTANYTALSARAVDAGYRLILVMSGVHNSLRKQTQVRLDRELTGEESPGVEKPPHGRQWIRITDSARDFSDQIGPEILQGGQPKLAVVKKTVPTLKKLAAWFESADPVALSSTPILLIDDEADQASINTGGDRPLADREDEDEAFLEEDDDDTSPSKTNELIRRILKALPRVSYVGYTATPFANVLINPDVRDREVGRDLFPSDFVVQLPRPAGYTGTRELFGDFSGEGRDVLRFVTPEEAAALRTRGGGPFRPNVTASLKAAIRDFLIAGAVRMFRGQEHDPNTMLIHTTHLTPAQGLIVELVREYFQELQGLWRYEDRETGAYRQYLRNYWEEEYRHHLDDMSEEAFDALVPYIDSVMKSVKVLELNSVAGDELNYSEKKGGQIVAVGGNRLSRGLTLEGLTVSYFLRTSTMADTLLQMGRWFGHRRGFEDLIRIYTTHGLASWFAELAVIEEDLRDEIYRLNESGASPHDIGVKLRCHSSFVSFPVKWTVQR